MGSGTGKSLLPGENVKKQLSSIVKELLLAFYAFLTDESIAEAVSRAQSFQPANDELRLDQIAVANALSAARARTASMGTGTEAFVKDWF